ncbi:nucleoside ABC transporter membrane protein [Hasllibacter halocynthiae]|uniref:Nucleoside ABC transporter membrane protein n=1 Tax=Hasllibacter halocynthiae TaxID=595589 RepID=A0A2T0X112_9RHOB|nr:ABC transporter permease [Hasllibacter halocynthiae]PRY92643.1 nucleoside ABC transporter membrane protein [Hasllibacter halocynthiae]
MIRVEPRPAPSRLWNALTPLLAVALTLAAGALMFAALGVGPGAALRTIFLDPLFDPRLAAFSRPQLLVKAAPLILIAIGLSLGFRAGIWNIGAEGQYLIGAVLGAAAGLALFPAESRLIFPLMVLCGLLGGLLWAMIPALLKAYARTNEILVSLLLVYVAENVVAWAALGPLRNPDGGGFPGSRQLSRWDAASNPELIAGTGAHWGVVAAMLAVVLAYALFARAKLGYDIRLAGEAPRAARFAGVSPPRLVILCFAVSGGLAGLAGIFEATGPSGQIGIDFGVGYGFTAIIVAFLGRLNPFGIVLAGLLMALTYIGGELAQMMVGIPLAAIQALQGMLLFFLLGVDVLSRYRVRLGRARPADVAAAPRAAEAAE